jgi:uncharacterized short protein YbdD (DUF466 family)
MSIENLKQNWQESFDKAVASVENYLHHQKDDYPEKSKFRQLAKWLMENPHNEYSYMPSGYQNFRSNPFETVSLLSTLHHALLDDGEVSFVKLKVEGEVRRVFMIFAWDNEDYFIPLCQKENKSSIDSIIRGRATLHRSVKAMKEKHPEKEFNVRPLLSEKDITFEAHHEPLLFIKEVEEFELQRNQRIERTEEMMSQVRKNKP